MKKYLVILLLLTSTSQSADILETFKNYRHNIRRCFDVDTSDVGFVSDSTLNEFIRISVITISPTIKATKKIFVDTTVFRRKTYSLDSTIVGIDNVFWEKGDSIKSLTYTPVDQWQAALGDLIKFLAEGEELERRPFLYDYTDDELLLYPTPIIGGDTIKIMAWRKIPSIAAVDSLAIIPQNYRSAILHYACYMVARAKQHSLKNDFKDDYREAMSFILSNEGSKVEAP